MQSILGEIAKLRNGAPITIDYRNSNRYRLVAQENNGSKTAYYFSTPIYNQKTRKLVDIKFHSNGNTIYAVGSNANITISGNILMENADGFCTIKLPQTPALVADGTVNCGNCAVTPTVNGVAMRCTVTGNGQFSFIAEVGQPFLHVRKNSKCLALMKEQFRPLVIFSCLGSLDAEGNVIAPARLEYEKLTDKKYRITVSPASPLAQYVLLECNLYENKLFQDTTVESRNPTSNNAFGSVGFIGNTAMYGEQWLYSRMDYSRMPETMDKHINKAVLHMPKLNHSNVEFSAFKVSARFCSFGSNWDNKIASGAPISDSSSDSGYQSVDITSLIVDRRTRTITRSEGLILRPKVKGSGFSVITTADSSYAPQILEVNFR